MSIQAMAPRVGVAVVFLTLGAVVLGVSGRDLGEPAEPGTDVSSCLIVTTEALKPAFASLGEWIDDCGGSSFLLTTDDLEPRFPGAGSSAAQFEYLEQFCRKNGYDVVILGGQESVLPFEGSFRDGHMVRTPVTTLKQAWVLVNQCRSVGAWSLDALSPNPDTDTSELAFPISPAPGSIFTPAYATAFPRRR